MLVSERTRCRWLRVLSFISALLALSAAGTAQTVRPLIVEYQGAARGHVDYVNDSFQPMTVVLEAKGFKVSETGEITYFPLPGSIHLKLSTMSFRIAPKQTYSVYYDAKADVVPAWFVLYADFGPTPERQRTGMSVHVELPHAVYVLPTRGELKKSDVTVEVAEFRSKDKKVVVQVANSGPNFGRVLAVDAIGRHDKADLNGFPLFPNSKRRVELDWKADGSPERLVLQLNKFTLQERITVVDR